jgi:lysophospholipase L1-like esterase
MRTYLRLLTGLLLISFAAGSVKAQSVAPFKAGDRVVFLGNSITDGGHYHSYIWLYYMTRFPNMRLTFCNAGIGGDNVKQMADRFDTDVMALKPTVLTVTWGMNDTGYFEWYKPDAAEVATKNIALAKERYAVLDENLKQQAGVRKIFILGSPYDETTTSNQNRLYHGKAAAFGQLIDFQEAAAKKNNYGVIDFHHPMLAINQREQAKDAAFSLTPNDRVHPDNDGHMVMAYLFLKTQGFTGKPVADVAINAGSSKVVKAINSTVKNVTGSNTGTAFDYLANALPYPVDTISRAWGNKKKQSDALALIPFTKEMNQELITVSGLKDGNYKLLIDNQTISTYSAKQLADGVNLSEQTRTPQYQQAIQIRELNEERWEIERRLRNYAFIEFDLLKAKGLLYADNLAALDTVEKASIKDIFVRGNKDNYLKAQYKSLRDAWQKEMDVLVNEIYMINKPQTHRIEIQAAN